MGDRAVKFGEDVRAVSILVEYLILTGILSVFVVIVGLHLHDVLTEAQVTRVVENQFADVASQISAIYTDYILLRPSQGYIKTKISMLPKVGDYHYSVAFEQNETLGVVYLTVRSMGGDFKAASGLGFSKFVKKGSKGGYIEIEATGNATSAQAESEEKKPEIEYNRTEKCPFEVKPRISFDPSSVEKGGKTNLTVFFEDAEQIIGEVNWIVRLWNGTPISGTGTWRKISITVSDTTGCIPLSSYDWACNATIFAEVEGKPQCNGTYSDILYVSEKPVESNPYLTYNKWVEPSEVSKGEIFEVHLKIEGRGFIQEAINLSTVHVIDISGSMINVALFKNFSTTIVPNVVRESFNLSTTGKIDIYVYTTDRLPAWYSNDACKACSSYTSECPWYGEGYDESFIKLYLKKPGDTTFIEVGSPYTDGSKLGKVYTINNAQAGEYDIEVVARAPEKINLTILVVKNSMDTILDKTVEYENYAVLSFDLPTLTNYTFVAVDIDDGVSLPNWKWSCLQCVGWCGYWDYADMQYITYYYGDVVESYSVSGYSRWWTHCQSACGGGQFYDGAANVWVIEPDSTKDFIVRSTVDWHYATNNYYKGVHSDFFKADPEKGEYKLIVVPTTRDPVNFKAYVYIKRIDAAKLAAKTFDSMLGDGDFVGLVTFSTDAEREVVNSTPLKYMTTDKSVVDSIIEQLKATLATDHPDALYYGAKVFPIWDEVGNNCTECINRTRPLIVLLTDGEPTICDDVDYFGCEECTCSCDGGSWCECAKDQALCIADYIKSRQINGFNISICTIGFGTDINDRTQQFLRDVASLRPDIDEKCYFFATTAEDLVEVYKTIFNMFQIAAKNINVRETLKFPIDTGYFELVDYSVYSNKGTPVDVAVNTYDNKTVISLDIPSIQKDEVVELTLWLKVRETTPEGNYDVNLDNESYIYFVPLNNLGQPTTNCPYPAQWNSTYNKCELPIVSTEDVIKVVSGSAGEIRLR